MTLTSIQHSATHVCGVVWFSPSKSNLPRQENNFLFELVVWTRNSNQIIMETEAATTLKGTDHFSICSIQVREHHGTQVFHRPNLLVGSINNLPF